MQHEEFVAGLAQDMVWGVRGLTRSVLIVWRGSGLVCYGFASLLALAPLLAFAAWTIAQGRYAALGWLVPGVLAHLAARPNLNLVDGLPWLACVVVGFAIGSWQGGLAVVATWMLSGALRGMVIGMLGERLRTSKDSYERLSAADQLITSRTSLPRK